MTRVKLAAFFTAIGLTFAGQISAQIGQLESAVGIWLLNEGTGDVADDFSENDNNGKLENGTGWGNGKFGMALEFDGTDDYVTVDTPDGIPLGNSPRTIVGWIKDTGTVKTWGGIVQYGQGNCTGKMFGLGKWDGNLAFWGGCKDFISGMPVPQDEWIFVAVSYDTTQITLWLNENSESKVMTDINTPASNLFMGIETIDNGESARTHFKGLIDEIAIFDTALADDDIRNIMENGIMKSVCLIAVSRAGKLSVTWGRIKNY